MGDDGAPIRLRTAGSLGLWALIEDELQAGKQPDPRHIAHALREGQPAEFSDDLRNYLAANLDRPPRGRPASRWKQVAKMTGLDKFRAIEDAARAGKQVDTRRIAEAFRQGQPSELSAELRNYLAAKFDTLYRAPRGRPTSKGKQQVVARQLIALVDELRAEEIGVRGKRGSLERALQRAGAGDMKRRYRRALKQCGMTARRMP